MSRRLELNASMAASTLAISAATLVVCVGAARMASTVASGGIDDHPQSSAIASLINEHDVRIDEYARRINGRSIFFAPVHEKSEVRFRALESRPAESPLLIAEGPPPHYTGPVVIWAIGDDVYFRKSPPTKTEKYIRLGVGDEQDGVRVLSIESLPRTVRVGHAGGEYDVPVFGPHAEGELLFQDPEFIGADPDGFVVEGETR